jgi:hypothetical protein
VLDWRGEIVRTSAAEAGVDSGAFAARLKSCPPENLTDVGVFPGYGVFPQAQCVGENSVVPPGLESFLPLSPALKRWAKLGRPYGAEFSDSSFASIVRKSSFPSPSRRSDSSFPSPARKSESSFSSIAQEQAVAQGLNRCFAQNLAFTANCKDQLQNGLNAALERCPTRGPILLAECIDAVRPIVTLGQLERAIRGVRRNKE